MGYSRVLLEQYKIYIGMADRISARRGSTNSFFLALNSSIFTAIAFLYAVVNVLSGRACRLST